MFSISAPLSLVSMAVHVTQELGFTGGGSADAAFPVRDVASSWRESDAPITGAYSATAARVPLVRSHTYERIPTWQIANPTALRASTASAKRKIPPPMVISSLKTPATLSVRMLVARTSQYLDFDDQ